jgi:Tfp pilus assembly protein PilN
MKFQLNLATSPQANNRPFAAGAALAGILGLLAFALLSHAAYASWRASRALREEIARWNAQIQTDRQNQQGLDVYFKSAGAAQVLDRSAFLNSLIDERSFPWTKIFMDLEQAVPPGVRIVSISPRLEGGRAEVTLEVGAITDESKIQFLQAIEKSKVFSGMVVKDERRIDQLGVPDKIVLNLTFWYSTT